MTTETETETNTNDNKHKFAEVFTPPELVKEILELLPQCKHIYEPGVGKGAFLEQAHILKYDTYEGCEINPSKNNYQSNVKIFEGDFFDQELKEYDLILGNPPFYQDGFKGPPCAKTRKGTTIWPKIVKRCWEHLKPNGILAMVLPCIWMKQDKEKIYDLFTENQILYLRTYTALESNKIFKYNAQTPCCYVIVQKTPRFKPMQIYDSNPKPSNLKPSNPNPSNTSNLFASFDLKPGYCIPTKNIQLIKDFVPTMKINPIKIAFIKKEIDQEIKANKLMKEPKDKFPIITTYKDTIYGYESNYEGKYQYTPKIIMAHKTDPILFMDEGKYGLYGRDKFIFLSNDNSLQEQYEYLSQPNVQKIIKSFTIRMNFIEKDIFKYISL